MGTRDMWVSVTTWVQWQNRNNTEQNVLSKATKKRKNKSKCKKTKGTKLSVRRISAILNRMP